MPAQVEEEKCIGCKLCIFVCPEPNMISFNQKEKIVIINPEGCKNCGLCLEVCPKEALALVRDV